MEETRLITVIEISRHATPDDCWLVIEDQVLDVTAFAREHPGGAGTLYKFAGRDATQAYSEVHQLSLLREHLPVECFKGNLDIFSVNEQWKAKSQAIAPKPPQPSDEKPPLHMVLNSYDFEEIAARTASKKAYAFYSTAATDCWTRDQNEAMLKRIWFRPRVMKNVAKVDTSSTMLGHHVNVPIFICPTGLAKLINPEAEMALARAAKSTGILEILSTSASHPLPTITSQAPNHPFLFQLYLNTNRAASAAILQSLPTHGITAIFLTVDAAGRGKRESDERLRTDEVIVNPVTGEKITSDKKGGGLTRAMGSYIDQSMTWADLAWIRQQTDLPIVLKGITGAADARLAMEYGVQGIVVSNHGGRNLDFAPPSILVLLELQRCVPEVFDRMEVYVDGGFRRGGDLVKALCLGAKAVGIGRTFLYALHYGQEGAEHLIELLKDEMESVMKLIGIKDLSEVHPGLVNTSDVDHLVPSSDEHPYAKWRPKPRQQAKL